MPICETRQSVQQLERHEDEFVVRSSKVGIQPVRPLREKKVADDRLRKGMIQVVR